MPIESEECPESLTNLGEYPATVIWEWLACRDSYVASGYDEVKIRIDGGTPIPTAKFLTRSNYCYTPDTNEETLWQTVFSHNDGSETQTFELELMHKVGSTLQVLYRTYTVEVRMDAGGPTFVSLSYDKGRVSILGKTYEVPFEDTSPVAYEYLLKIQVQG